MYGADFHPIMQMAKNASVLQKIADGHADGAITLGVAEAGNPDIIDASTSAKLANEAWDKIAPYTEPKLKATEITGADGGPVQVEAVERVIVDPKNPNS